MSNSTLMTKRDTAELLVFINSVYPSFEVTQNRIDTWTRLLADQNKNVVMKNVEKYAMNQKFPPAVADLREVKSESKSNDFLKQLDRWEKNAIGHKPRS